MVKPSQLPVREALAPVGVGGVGGVRAVSSRALGPPRILFKRDLPAASAARKNAATDIFSGEAAAVDRMGHGGGVVYERREYLERYAAAEAAAAARRAPAALVVSPSSALHFTGPFVHRSHAVLNLTNLSNEKRMAYRIKSTAPKGRLAVKPCRYIIH